MDGTDQIVLALIHERANFMPRMGEQETWEKIVEDVQYAFVNLFPPNPPAFDEVPF